MQQARWVREVIVQVPAETRGQRPGVPRYHRQRLGVQRPGVPRYHTQQIHPITRADAAESNG